MTRPTLDFETYSAAGFAWSEADQKWRAPPGAREKGLWSVTAPAYSEHPSTELLTGSYDLCDGHGVRRLGPHLPPPEDLFVHVTRPGAELESHNAMFERLIWMNVCVPRYGYPPLPPIVQRCSMATARTQSLPGKLEALGDVLRLDVQKDAEGKRLIRKFCIPRDPTKKDPRLRIMPADDPEDFERLALYCDRDVLAEQSASGVMMPMSPTELECWRLNQEINWRGLGIDREGVRDCIAVLEGCMERYGAECREITGGIGPSQVQALVGWIAGRMHGPAFRAAVQPQYSEELDDEVAF